MAGNTDPAAAGSGPGAASAGGPAAAPSCPDQQDASGHPDQQPSQVQALPQLKQPQPQQSQPAQQEQVHEQKVAAAGQEKTQKSGPGPSAAFAKAKQQLVQQQQQEQSKGQPGQQGSGKQQVPGRQLLSLLQKKTQQQRQQGSGQKLQAQPPTAAAAQVAAQQVVSTAPGKTAESAQSADVIAANPGSGAQEAGLTTPETPAKPPPAAAALGKQAPAKPPPAKQTAKAAGAAGKQPTTAASPTPASAATPATPAAPLTPAAASTPSPETPSPATPQTLGTPGSGAPPKSGARARSAQRSSSNGSGGNGSGASSFTVGSSAGRGGPKFAPYMDRALLQQEMKRGHIFRAKFRVNAGNRTEAFCTLDNMPSDVMVRGESQQNRAVEGDVVAIMPQPLSEWFVVHKETAKLVAAAAAAASNGEMPEEDALQRCDRLSRAAIAAYDEAALRRAQEPWLAASSPQEGLEFIREVLRSRPDLRCTARVVSIIDPSPRRENLVGVLLPAGSGCLFLAPLDNRMPRCMVQANYVAQLPKELRDEAHNEDVTQRTFVSAVMGEWPSGHPYPPCTIRQSLGQAGGIESGTAAILSAEAIKTGDFEPEVYSCLPKLPWTVSESDIASRRDLRSLRIFSIDPITAKDLDDALSIEPLDGGSGFRVGVHIADVAAFVKPGSALDEEAAARGTSVYMVQRVIPMLPSLLCEQLCSLNPGQDRFAFSIIWELSPEGEIKSQWAGRTVINSCAKLAYPMVQQMIEDCFKPEDWQVKLFNGVTWEQLIEDSLLLNGIARHLRGARFSNGALRLDNTRLSFALDTAGNPVQCAPYVQAEANALVEEFMLLANMSVARFIADAFPDRAILRRHPLPSERKMKELLELTQELGIHLDASSSGGLHRTLSAAREALSHGPCAEALTLMLTKPMQLAQYFCTGDVEPEGWRHFALAMDQYTHFTSPIRRYPDVLVHRLLAAALELQALRQQQAADKDQPNGQQQAEGKQEEQGADTAAVQSPAPMEAATPAAAPDGAAAAAANPSAANEASPVAGTVIVRPAFGALITVPGAPAHDAPNADAAAAPTAAATAATIANGTGPGVSATAPTAASATDAAEVPAHAAGPAAPVGTADAAEPASADGIDVEALLARHGLPPADDLRIVAAACNDSRLAARNAQDASLRLFLSILLRDAPAVTEGVVVGLGGDKFLTVYIPEFGTEARIYVDQLGVPVRSEFDTTAKTFTIHRASPEDEAGAASSSGGSGNGTAGSGAGFQRGGPSPQRGGGRGSSSNGRGGGNGRGSGRGGRGGTGPGSSGGSNAGSPDFDLDAWLATLKQLRNPRALQPEPLPLKLKMFTQVTLVVGALISRLSGHPIDICARLYVQGAPAQEVLPEKGTGEVAAMSVLTADALLED